MGQFPSDPKNRAGYFEVWGSRPLPARICTGTDHVGLNGAVEMDAVAQL
jgi:hypothetical protein